MSISLTIDYGDGSKKVFLFDKATSLLELFQLANKTKAGLETDWSTDRGPIEIFGYQIDGQPHMSKNPGRWALTRNDTDFWPEHSEFEAGPLNDGDCIVFTLRGE